VSELWQGVPAAAQLHAMAIEALSTLACHHNQACTQPLLSASCAAQVLVVCSAFVNTDKLTAVRQQARALGVGVENPSYANKWHEHGGQCLVVTDTTIRKCIWGVFPGCGVRSLDLK
jgi:hypothetical protein